MEIVVIAETQSADGKRVFRYFSDCELRISDTEKQATVTLNAAQVAALREVLHRIDLLG